MIRRGVIFGLSVGLVYGFTVAYGIAKHGQL